MSPIRILLLVAQAITGTALCESLSEQEGLSLVCVETSGKTVVDRAQQEQPHLLLIDIVANEKIVHLLPAVLAASPRTRIIMLTDKSDLHLQRQFVLQGALGVVPKNAPPEQLLEAIRRVHGGGVWLEGALLRSVIEGLQQGTEQGTEQEPPPAHGSDDAARVAAITPRESDVLLLVGEGLSNKQIAWRLGLSERTVHRHLSSLFLKLGVGDRLGLTLFGYRTGLLSIPARQRPGLPLVYGMPPFEGGSHPLA